MLIRILFGLLLTVASAAMSAPIPIDPTAEAQFAKASEELQAAATRLDAAKLQLSDLRAIVARPFESRPEWIAAKKALEKADRDRTDARLIAMKKDPEYASLQGQFSAANAFLELAIKNAHAHYKRNVLDSVDDAIVSAALDKIDAEIAIKAIEIAIMQKDSGYISAQSKYNDAKAVWDVLQVEVEIALKQRPEYRAIQNDWMTREAEYRGAKNQFNKWFKALRPLQIAQPRS